ncbi:MAG: hypothetical protein JW734_00370 [Candidatus Omnitrophica bacterium]|nr:hypothetical protein [Candidatus Omnitrophota bacterium]
MKYLLILNKKTVRCIIAALAPAAVFFSMMNLATRVNATELYYRPSRRMAEMREDQTIYPIELLLIMNSQAVPLADNFDLEKVLSNQAFNPLIAQYSKPIISKIVTACLEENLDIDALVSFLNNLPEGSTRATCKKLPQALQALSDTGMNKDDIFPFLETTFDSFTQSSLALEEMMAMTQVIQEQNLLQEDSLSLLKLLGDESPFIRASALMVLGLRKDNPEELMTVSLGLLNENHRLGRAVATWNLLKMEGPFSLEILAFYANTLSELKGCLTQALPNSPENIVKRVKMVTFLLRLEPIIKHIDPDQPLFVQETYAKLDEKYNYRVKQILGWINSEEELPVVDWVISAATSATRRAQELGYNITITPYFLYAAAIAEGFGDWMDNEYYGHENKNELKGNLADMIGLHHWSQGIKEELEELKSLGFIDRDMQIDSPATGQEALEVMAALLFLRGRLFLNEARGRQMDSTEINFFTYAYYNVPETARSLFKKRYASRFEELIRWDGAETINSVRCNAIRTISQEESLLKLGVFAP